MLNSLRDGQINYGTTNCPQSAHIPPHNVVAPVHQNSLHSTEPSTPVVYPWNSNPRLEHLYGFHSRYYNLDFPSPYPPATNQYVPTNLYGQNVPQCCQPCCRLRSQNISKTSPPQVLYNPIRPVQQLNRSYKSKKTLKTPCSEQFLPYIANDLPSKYDTQNCYQQKYGSSYLNNTNYCPPANNLWIPPATNPTWSADRLRPAGRHTSATSHTDFNREKSYQRLQHYQTNPYSNPSSSTHHRPYNYIPPLPDVQNYRPSVYHNSIKSNTSEYVSQEHNSRFPISSQINQSPASLQQYYNAQPVPYTDVQRPSESFKPSQVTPQNSSKSNLNVREFLANWDEGEEEICEKSSETTAPIVVLDCMTLEGDALTKIQEKLNVVSYENLEKVLKENNNPLVINTESSEIDSINNKAKSPSKPNFEPIDYTKRETGIIKPFITEKKRPPTTNTQSDKNYSVNFDGMVAWYGKKNTDISSTDLIEKLADRIFNLSKSQENDGVSFGTASYTGQITQTNRSVANSVENSSKYLQSQHMYGLQQHTEKCIEPSVINKIDCNNDSVSRIYSCISNENKKSSTVKSNNINSSCIVENITKKCLNVTNEETTPWNLDQGTQEQHLNMSLYDHSVIIKPLDFSSFTDETKCNPFVFEKNTSSGNRPNNSINDQFNKVLNENNNYNATVSNNQQIDSTNRNFPVIVSPHVHRQEYNGLHESVIQRTGCDKNKHDKVPTQTDFESMNWNISNDIDKIMKNTNISMEQSCLYDRSNYNILDSMNSDKNISAQWKDNVPCVDLTVNSKTNNNHDSFFDSWNFIENYENHSNKKLINPHSSSNEVHNPLFSNQITSLEETNNKQNSSEKMIENETLIPIKDIPNDMSSNNIRSQDVFNLHNRIPDFSDGFELPVIHEPPDYMQFKKTSNDNERRTDGSIFEHLNETKCRTVNEITNTKNDQNKSDIIGLPSFKEKEPLAPMLVPPKLNIVKPILRDPSQLYTVIKQKLKYDNTCIDNDSAVSNKTGNNFRGNHPINFNMEDLKSKYNSIQINQFDVWSEKFELKSNSTNSSSTVVHCDVEITQFKSNPDNRNALTPKPNISEDYQDKNEKLPENTNCNLTMDKMNVIENEKLNSNDFLNCLENTKTDDQKYRDTLDEFETSFGFDMHCNNESNKSFHEDIVDKCLEERIKDQIGEPNMNSSDSSITQNTNISPNSSQLPFQCDFQSSYLIKNYFDENKNKTIIFDRKQISNEEKSNKTTPFNYHSKIEHDFEIQNNKNIHVTQNTEKNNDYHALNNVTCDTEQIQNDNKKNNSNFLNQAEFKPAFESNHKNSNTNNLPCTKKNNEDYLSIESQNYKYENNKKNNLESSDSKEVIESNKLADNNDVCKLSQSDSNIHKLSNIRKHSIVNFELNINNSNIFETNSNTNTKSKTETIKNLELENIKNTFDSTFDSENSVNIKQHNFNTKNIYGINNNNRTLYESQNLEKINEFDFETRIIQNFDMECSNSNVQDLTISKEVFNCENLMKTKYNLQINDENNSQKVSYFKSTPTIDKVHNIQKTSDLDCNNITQLDNVIEAENANQKSKIDHAFEIDCSISNIQQEKNPEIHKDFDFQNKNAEEIKLDNCCTHENSNINNNTEVENIFEKFYGNLTTLNTKKVDFNISDRCRHSYNEFNVSKNQKNIQDQNLKTNSSTIIDEDYEKTINIKCQNEPIETLNESDTVLLQELVDNSTSNLTPTLLEHTAILENKLISEESDSRILNKHVPNKNENALGISNTNATHENTKTFEEQQSGDFQQDKIELLNQNNMQAIKNMSVDIVQGDTIKKMFENINSDLLNAVENTDITNNNEQNNSYGSCLNLDELSSQQYSNQIVEVQHSTYSRSRSLNFEKPICKQKPKIVEIESSTNSESSFLNHADLPCLQNSSKIEIENSANSISNILDHAKLTHQHSNEIIDVEDSVEFESSLLNSAEFASQQNSNNINDVENLVSYKSNTSNHVVLNCQQNSINNFEVENSAGSESNQSSHTELACLQDSHHIIDVENLTSSETSSSIHAELVCQKNLNYNVKDQHFDSPKSSSSNKTEFVYRQNSNKIVEDEDSACSEICLSSHAKFTDQHNVNNIDKDPDPGSLESSSLNYSELACQRNSNNTVEIEDSSCSELSSSNYAELDCQQNSNNTVKVKDSSSSELSLSNHAELACQQNLNYCDEVQYCASPESTNTSLNNTDFECKQNTDSNTKQNLIEVEGLNSAELNLSNHDELTYQQNVNNVVKVASSESNFSNYTEYPCQKKFNYNVEVEDCTSPKSSSLNNTEFVCQQNANNTAEVDDSSSSKLNSLNHAELACRQNLNYNDEIEDCASPESTNSSLNIVEFVSEQNSNNTVEVEDSNSPELNLLNHNELPYQQNVYNVVEAQDLSSSDSNLSNHAELVCQQNNLNYHVEGQNLSNSKISSPNHTEPTCLEHFDNIVEIENLITPSCSRSTSSSNYIKSIFQKHSSNTVKAEDLTGHKYSSIHKTKSTRQQSPYKPIEVKVSTNCKSSLVNHVEIACQQYSSEISGIEDSIGPRPGLLNDNTLTCQQNPNDIIDVENLTSKKSSALFDNRKQLPRVKFILKCHRKNMINSNIFDEESIVPLKKCNLFKGKKFIARHIFKKNNKFYKPWRSIYQKESVDEPKEIIKEVIETVCSKTINVDNSPQSIESLSFNDKDKENKVLSSSEVPYSNEEQSIEKSSNVENEEIDINTCDNIVDNSSTPDKLNTPMPSPFDDFQSKNPTPEHYGDEEYWDKSLENEYKNVLHKTISKLTKIRVNIRDKFDIRLLARRVNVAKQRKWRRQCRQRRRLDTTKSINDNMSDFVVDDIKVPTEILTLNATTEKITTNPICKIKVQLPWGRIFNLNNSGVEDYQKTKDTKLELGPAKVEVRLSQTPGEWQVAACESMTSSKSVVSVRRLVLQRASPAKEDYSDSYDSPPKDFDSDINSPPKNFGEDCNSPEKYNDGGCHNSTKNCDGDCSTICNSSKDDSGCSSNNNSSKYESDLKEHFGKLPKIVIRRIGQDNNYTSFVSSSSSEGGDKNDGTRQLMVRLVRDLKLDAMAVEGITTVHLKHNVPISESAADTHGAKRVRYT